MLQCPTVNERWRNCPSSTPFHHVSRSSSPAVFSCTAHWAPRPRSTVWAPHPPQLLLTKSHLGIPDVGLSKCLANKAELLDNHHCRFQGPLSREADLQPSWVLCYRSTSTEIQVKRFGFCQKPVGSWFLLRGCCAGLYLTFASFILSFREIWGEQRAKALLHSPDAMNPCINKHNSNQGRKKRFGWRN